MITHYLNNFLRYQFRHKFHSFITLSGLIVGIAAFLLISLFVIDELKFDNFHSKRNTIYRLTKSNNSIGDQRHLAHVWPNLGKAIANDFPLVKRSAQLGFTAPIMLGLGEKYIIPKGSETFYASAKFFEIFDFNVVRGDLRKALAEPYSLVLTSSMAEEFFGSSDAIGELLSYYVYGGERKPLTVTAIVEDVPESSHLQFNHLVSFKTLEDINKNNSGWIRQPTFTYLELNEGVDLVQLEGSLTEYSKGYSANLENSDYRLKLQSLKDIHLGSAELQDDRARTGDRQMVFILLIVALGILSMASINYINLVTARSFERAKEVGIRKSFGAARKQLIFQFLTESVLLTLMALALAILLLETVLPQYNAFVGKSLSIDYVNQWFWILGFGLILGMLAGVYPSFLLTRHNPVNVMRKNSRSGTGSQAVRRSLLFVQFAFSLILIISTGVINSQLDYIKKRDIGIVKEGIIQTVIPSNRAGGNEAFKNELLSNPLIDRVGRATVRPLYNMNSSIPNEPTMVSSHEGWLELAEPLRRIEVGFDFIETFGIELIAGRSFSAEMPTDLDQGIILNEKAIRTIGWNNASEALGNQIRYFGKEAMVIGVVKDFNFEGLRNEILPFALTYSKHSPMVFVKFKSDDLNDIVSFVQSSWEKHATTNEPFDFQFMSSLYDQYYDQEARLEKTLTGFTSLSIFITIMGLLGLISFAVRRRQKEIGIRKVLGASIANLYLLLSKDFVRLFVLAGLIVIPIVLIVMKQWLDQFAYRTDMSLAPFLIGVAILAVITLATISYHVLRSARENPARILADE